MRQAAGSDDMLASTKHLLLQKEQSPMKQSTYSPRYTALWQVGRNDSINQLRVECGGLEAVLQNMHVSFVRIISKCQGLQAWCTTMLASLATQCREFNVASNDRSCHQSCVETADLFSDVVEVGVVIGMCSEYLTLASCHGTERSLLDSVVLPCKLRQRMA